MIFKQVQLHVYIVATKRFSSKRGTMCIVSRQYVCHSIHGVAVVVHGSRTRKQTLFFSLPLFLLLLLFYY